MNRLSRILGVLLFPAGAAIAAVAFYAGEIAVQINGNVSTVGIVLASAAFVALVLGFHPLIKFLKFLKKNL